MKFSSWNKPIDFMRMKWRRNFSENKNTCFVFLMKIFSMCNPEEFQRLFDRLFKLTRFNILAMNFRRDFIFAHSRSLRRVCLVLGFVSASLACNQAMAQPYSQAEFRRASPNQPVHISATDPVALPHFQRRLVPDATINEPSQVNLSSPLSASPLSRTVNRERNVSSGGAQVPEAQKIQTIQKIQADSAVAAQRWQAAPPSSLHQVVRGWAEREGYQLVWDADYDYPIRARLDLDGRFIDVMGRLFGLYTFAERPLRVDLYKEQRLVRVQAGE